MSRAWMPLYTGDLERDTMHLGPTEFGIYVRLILHAWHHGGAIPLDRRKLCNITRCDPRFWWRFGEPTVQQFFDVVDASTATQKRVLTELQRSDEISNKRSAAAKQKQSKSSASAEQKHTQSPSPSHTTEEGKKEPSSVVALAGASRGSRLPPDWQPAIDDLKFAGELGLRAYEIDNEANKFRDYWHGKAGSGASKRDWPATWRNWCRTAIERKPNGKGNGSRAPTVSEAFDYALDRAGGGEVERDPPMVDITPRRS